MTYPDNVSYALAAGFNTFPLTTLAGYKPGGVVRAFDFFIGFGTYNPGAIRDLPTGVYVAGYETTQWLPSIWDFDQDLYFRNTYCAGGYSGQVTVAVTTKDVLTLVYWNAICRMQKQSDMRAYRPGWDHPAITFSKRSVATPP